MIRPNSLPLVGKEKGNLKGFLLAKKKKPKNPLRGRVFSVS